VIVAAALTVFGDGSVGRRRHIVFGRSRTIPSRQQLPWAFWIPAARDPRTIWTGRRRIIGHGRDRVQVELHADAQRVRSDGGRGVFDESRRARARPRRAPFTKASTSRWDCEFDDHQATQVIVQTTGGGSQPSTAQRLVPFQTGAAETSKQVGQIPAVTARVRGRSSVEQRQQGDGSRVGGLSRGIVDRVVKLSNGEYEVHTIGVNWPHHVFVNQDFKVVGAD